MREMARRGDESSKDVPNVRNLVRPLIQLNASEADVQKAADEIEKKMGEDAAVRKEIYRIATTIVGSGKLENYGTEKAQDFLRRWAKEAEEGDDKPAKADGDNPKR